jgi:hypothetical protein
MTKNLRNATTDEIARHEQRTKASVQFGSYNMSRHAPRDEIKYFHLELSDGDLNRLFLLWESTFIPHTLNNSCRLTDVTPTAASMAMARCPPGGKISVDLTSSTGQEPILITTDLNCGPLITIDGNHRLTAHYLRHRRVDGVKVFLGVHLDWNFIPPLAKEYSMQNPMDRPIPNETSA